MPYPLSVKRLSQKNKTRNRRFGAGFSDVGIRDGAAGAGRRSEKRPGTKSREVAKSGSAVAMAIGAEHCCRRWAPLGAKDALRDEFAGPQWLTGAHPALALHRCRARCHADCWIAAERRRCRQLTSASDRN